MRLVLHRSTLVASLLTLSLFLGGGGCSLSNKEPTPTSRFAQKIVTDLRDAPTSEFLNDAGAQISLSAYAGDVVLVNYWATWCAPCEAELPSLGKLQAAFQDRNFRVVAISVDDDGDIDYARQRLTTLTAGNLAFYRLITNDWRVYYETGARGFPTSIILDPSGREIARVEGDVDWFSDDAQAYVADLLR